MSEFFKSIGMPQSLREFGIEKNCIPRLVDLCTFHNTRTVKSYKELDANSMKEIFESCY